MVAKVDYKWLMKNRIESDIPNNTSAIASQLPWPLVSMDYKKYTDMTLSDKSTSNVLKSC